MKKEIILNNKTIRATLNTEDSEWLLRDIPIGNLNLEELYVPDQKNDLPQNLNEFIKFLGDNWDSIYSKSKAAIDFLSKDWFQSGYQPEFALEYGVLEKTDSIGSFRLHFYEGF